MRHEAKLIVTGTRKETKLLFADEKGYLSKPNNKINSTPKILNIFL